jgi:hypothetical protein
MNKNISRHMNKNILPHMNKNILSHITENDFTFLVPAFHVYAHADNCNRTMHPYKHPEFGLIDGETTERKWSPLGRFCSITSNQTTANRLETLNDL